ncbi:xanthine dehydrogenase small subunit [Caenimonas terrae]|uniref:Xanthine dehydrogenase small subunit n=1 Tax=Caenimonas terrae TaxID=696074 RepID=A0ABW0NES3_9BURK
METSPLAFIRRGQPVTLGNVPPGRTLLEVLREDLGATGTKEGCGEGDCGACTVVIGELEGDCIRYRAINSCIRLAHSVQGMAVWAVEDIAGADGTLHPAQEAMVRCHGSQCGFCTPGFVMSLFGIYQKYIAPTLVTTCTSLPPEGAFAPRGSPAALSASPPAITREVAQEELSGNLCRCTGYRPIFDAAQQMETLPAVKVDEKALVRQLRALACVRAEPVEALASTSTSSARTGFSARTAYLLPKSLQQLLALRASHPQAQIVAGCTDVGLWGTKLHMTFDSVLDVTQVRELKRVEHYDRHIAIGAAATLTDAFDALVQERPQLKTFAQRFAGLPVRNSGTLGGNVANGSPIGDSMPLLIALGANVVLMSARGHRELPLEQFYSGYRKTVLAPDEVVAWIKVPRPQAGEFLRAYKISKRFDDDISAVCLVVNMRLEGDVVASIGIGAGGVAATPIRAAATESLLLGKPWTQAAAQEAAVVLRAEFRPISDMRASAGYRTEVLGNLMRRFWLESQGVENINLELAVIPGLTRHDNIGAGA